MSSAEIDTATRVQTWMKLFAFHKALITLEKVQDELFSLQLWVNSRADWAIYLWYGDQSKSRKSLNSLWFNFDLKMDLVSYVARAAGLDYTSKHISRLANNSISSYEIRCTYLLNFVEWSKERTSLANLI